MTVFQIRKSEVVRRTNASCRAQTRYMFASCESTIEVPIGVAEASTGADDASVSVRKRCGAKAARREPVNAESGSRVKKKRV